MSRHLRSRTANQARGLRAAGFWAAMALVTGALIAGCGSVQLAGADQTAAGVSATPAVQQTEPLIVTPTPGPAPVYNPPLQMGHLMAVVTSFDKPGFLGFMGTATAHVTVSNPTQVPLSGTLTVQFTDKGTPKGDPQTQQVTVDPSEGPQQFNIQYKATFHFIDGASVSVATESPAGTNGTVGVPGTSTASGIYGSAPGYGSPAAGSTGGTAAAPGY